MNGRQIFFSLTICRAENQIVLKLIKNHFFSNDFSNYQGEKNIFIYKKNEYFCRNYYLQNIEKIFEIWKIRGIKREMCFSMEFFLFSKIKSKRSIKTFCFRFILKLEILSFILHHNFTNILYISNFSINIKLYVNLSR